MRYPFSAISNNIYIRIYWNIINYTSALPSDSSQSPSFKLTSSSESKLEQDSSLPSNSLSEISRNKLAISSELRPFLQAIVSGVCSAQDSKIE
ncbi:UNVERIFIED_CONTAM: hypothetical protein NCL1_21868 [Trichonephila clavipes]